MTRTKSTFLTLVAVLLSPMAAKAGLIQYEDQSMWLSDAGTVTFTEDFEGFVGSTSFLNTSVVLNQMTLEASGAQSPQTIATTTFPENDVNGTIQMNGITDYPLATTVSLVFDNPVSAWGADFRGHNGVENLLIDLLDLSGGVLSTLDATNNGPAFLGFVATSGEQVGSLLFRSGVDGFGARESFGMDNIVGVATPVPEPGTLALLGIGLLGIGATRRRKKA